MSKRIQRSHLRSYIDIDEWHPSYGHSAGPSTSKDSPHDRAVFSVHRRMPLMPKSVRNCPRRLQRQRIEDKTEFFRRSFLENVELSERRNGEFHMSNEEAERIYWKYCDWLQEDLEQLDRIDVNCRQTEYATLGPSGCLEYMKWQNSVALRKAQFLSSPDVMIVSAPRLDFDLNNSRRTNESFDFTCPGATYFVRLGSDGRCAVVPETDTSVAGAFAYSELYESVTIEVYYDTIKTNKRSATITMKNESDIDFAEAVFSKNGIRTSHVINADGFLNENSRDLALYDMPEFIDNTEYLNWFIGSILSANNLEYEHVRFDTTRVKGVRGRSWHESRFTEPSLLFTRELIEVACIRRVWRGGYIGFDDHLDEVVLDKDLHPFHIEELRRVNNWGHGEKGMVARFVGKNVAAGIAVAEGCLQQRRNIRFMQFTGTKFFPARLFPKYRKMLLMPRSVRYACDEAVSKFDEKIRNFWVEYEKEHPKEFDEQEMDKNFLRVVDVYDEESEEGFTGIEGWPPSSVDMHLDMLRTIFEPKEFVLENEDEHLQYGRGEAFVQHVVKEMKDKVVIDFDRFNSKLLVIGDNTELFIGKLKKFETECLNVKAKIPFYAPYLNDHMRSLVKKNVLRAMGSDLSASIVINKEYQLVEFEGPFIAFKLFSNIISTINRDIFAEMSRHLPAAVRTTRCPICFDDSADYYRLDSCGHVYCRSCLNNLVRSSMESSNPAVKCYHENCTKTICPMDIKQILLGDENRVKSLDAMKLRTFFSRTINGIVQHPGSKFKVCKTADCIGLLEASGTAMETTECSKCNRRYCQLCLEEPHASVPSCEEYARIRQDADLSLQTYTTTMGSGKLKRCPTKNCAAVIVKGQGCNHVECPYCKIHFCWLCLFSSEQMSEVYKHMSDNHGSYE